MVTLTADVTEQIKKLTSELVKQGMYKSQSEVVRDAIRQLAMRYNASIKISKDELRKRVSKAGKKAGTTLSKTLKEIRNE